MKSYQKLNRPLEAILTKLTKEFRRQEPEVRMNFCATETVALTALSFVTMRTCGSSRSPFCQKARVIPNAIIREFQEPPRPKNLLPRNLN